jgi:hypothetical protein
MALIGQYDNSNRFALADGSNLTPANGWSTIYIPASAFTKPLNTTTYPSYSTLTDNDITQYAVFLPSVDTYAQTNFLIPAKMIASHGLQIKFHTYGIHTSSSDDNNIVLGIMGKTFNPNTTIASTYSNIVTTTATINASKMRESTVTITPQDFAADCPVSLIFGRIGTNSSDLLTTQNIGIMGITVYYYTTFTSDI